MSKSVAKILIVDDDELLREILMLMLSDYYVIEADNGRTAVEVFNKHLPDIVLMDVVMPEMDGVMATKQIISKYPNAKIVAITAFAFSKGKEMIDAGAKDVVSKPVRKEELIKVIEKYLND
jgi:CheY-like chemotaxis protein